MSAEQQEPTTNRHQMAWQKKSSSEWNLQYHRLWATKTERRYVRKRIMEQRDPAPGLWQDYIGSVPKYDGFCTVPEHIGYRPWSGKVS